MGEVFIYSTLAIVYAALALFSGIFYGFGNTAAYANAKSLFVALFWPLFWLGVFVWSFIRWVTTP